MLASNTDNAFYEWCSSIQITNILKGTIMSEKEELPRKEIEILNMKVDKLPLTIDELNAKLSKHIGSIDETYEGLKNPTHNAARRFLGR